MVPEEPGISRPSIPVVSQPPVSGESFLEVGYLVPREPHIGVYIAKYVHVRYAAYGFYKYGQTFVNPACLAFRVVDKLPCEQKYPHISRGV